MSSKAQENIFCVIGELAKWIAVTSEGCYHSTCGGPLGEPRLSEHMQRCSARLWPASTMCLRPSMEQ